MKTLHMFIFSTLFATSLMAESYVLKSPDGKLQVNVEISDNIRFSVNHEQTEVLAPSPVSMTLADGRVWGEKPGLKSKKTQSVNQIVSSPLYKKKEIPDIYNELTLNFKGNYSMIFRAYDQGVAYRFAATSKDSIYIQDEEVNLHFSHNYPTIVPYVRQDNPQTFEEQFFNSFENTYTHSKLSDLDKKRLMFLPLIVELNDGKKLCITEADLESYPGLYLNKGESQSLQGVFAPYPKQVKQGGHNMLQGLVTERESYIAKCQGNRNFPWRVFVVSTNDKELLDNDLVYLLAEPSRVKDISWIKPGKVAWEWWNDWNIYGVDFKSGINNETYKYYIDFASENGIEYVILDEGWAVNKKADLLQVIPQLDIQELIDYGKSRNVGIILCSGYDCTISYGIHTNWFFKKTMFSLFYGIFKMFRSEKWRCCIDDYIYTTIDNLFVCIQAYKTFIGGNIDIFLVFQFFGQAVHSFLEYISQCNDCYAICRIQEVECCTRSASSTTDYARFQFFSVRSLIGKFRDIVAAGFF
jgi:alpha-glucosidase